MAHKKHKRKKRTGARKHHRKKKRTGKKVHHYLMLDGARHHKRKKKRTGKKHKKRKRTMGALPVARRHHKKKRRRTMGAKGHMKWGSVKSHRRRVAGPYNTGGSFADATNALGH